MYCENNPSQFLANVICYIVFTFLKVHSIPYIIYYSLLMATFPLCQLSYSCIYYCHGTGYNGEMNTRECVYVLEYVLISLTLMFMWYSFEMRKSNDDIASFFTKVIRYVFLFAESWWKNRSLWNYNIFIVYKSHTLKKYDMLSFKAANNYKQVLQLLSMSKTCYEWLCIESSN